MCWMGSFWVYVVEGVEWGHRNGVEVAVVCVCVNDMGIWWCWDVGCLVVGFDIRLPPLLLHTPTAKSSSLRGWVLLALNWANIDWWLSNISPYGRATVWLHKNGARVAMWYQWEGDIVQNKKKKKNKSERTFPLSLIKHSSLSLHCLFSHQPPFVINHNQS